MNEISELAKIIDNKLNTLKSDDILVVVYLPTLDTFVLKIMKQSMYIPNTKICEIGPFTRNFSYKDILRLLDYNVELAFKYN